MPDSRWRIEKGTRSGCVSQFYMFGRGDKVKYQCTVDSINVEILGNRLMRDSAGDSDTGRIKPSGVFPTNLQLILTTESTEEHRGHREISLCPLCSSVLSVVQEGLLCVLCCIN
jgi:hypothetical protein